MIRVIYVGSYDCEPKYIVRVNSLVQHEYAEQPFIAMLCKPHNAEYNLQYIDYGMEDDTIQAYVELLMDCKDQATRLAAFDRLWDYLMGEGI